jgi:hypothetical protein
MHSNDQSRLTVTKNQTDMTITVLAERAGLSAWEVVDEIDFRTPDFRYKVIQLAFDRVNEMVRQREEEFSINLTP